MFIPKSKMSLISAMLEAAVDSPLGHSLDDDEHELINQIRDKVSLCQHGDANFLEIQVCYSNKPPTNTALANNCGICGAELINGSCYNC